MEGVQEEAEEGVEGDALEGVVKRTDINRIFISFLNICSALVCGHWSVLPFFHPAILS